MVKICIFHLWTHSMRLKIRKAVGNTIPSKYRYRYHCDTVPYVPVPTYLPMLLGARGLQHPARRLARSPRHS